MFRFTQIALSLGILIAGGLSAEAAGTAQQRRACRGDAMRLCRDAIPNVGKITLCMQQKMAQLSPACRAQF